MGKSMTLPKVNISETKENFKMDVAAPGLHKKDLKIDVTNNVLTISAEKEENKEENHTWREYNYSSFTRSFTLPDDVVADKIEATYDGGILRLILPRQEKEPKPNSKPIAIK